MAKLTSASRNALPAKSFSGPNRSYPIPDVSHARNALARASGNASPSLQASIRAKVHAKFPSIGKSGGGHHPRMHALAIASANHLKKMGHISDGHHAKIHAKAKSAMKKPAAYGAIHSSHYLSTPTPTSPDEEGGMGGGGM